MDQISQSRIRGGHSPKIWQMRICKVDHRVTTGLSNYNHNYSLKIPGAGGPHFTQVAGMGF